MKYFKKMCELLARGPQKTNFISEEFFSIVPESRSIIVHDVKDIMRGDKEISSLNGYIDEINPIPFRVTAFEFHGSDYLVTNNKQLKIKCMVVEDVGPDEYDIYSLLQNLETNEHEFLKVNTEDKFGFAALQIIHRITSLLNSECRGIEEVNSHAVYRNKKGKKKKHVINKVIHLCSKSKKESLIKNKVVIDWSHRWEVRGHWRDISGLGKNRAGEYCVSGKTWVVEHVKGPESQPLIRKVRILDVITFQPTP